MQEENRTDVELAAALFSRLGAQIPHDYAREEEADEILRGNPDREKCLLKVAELCGDPVTPRQLYLVALAYSWLGRAYCRQAAHYADEYLHTSGWDALPSDVREEDGIVVNHSMAQRAAVLVDLANAQEAMGDGEKALFNFMEAYRLEPHNAMNAIRAADLLSKLRGQKEALDFLRQQKLSSYYEPVVYRDRFGETRRNDLFKQLLDAAILKMGGKIKPRSVFP